MPSVPDIILLIKSLQVAQPLLLINILQEAGLNINESPEINQTVAVASAVNAQRRQLTQRGGNAAECNNRGEIGAIVGSD
jgi:hypothetical protein